MFLGFPGGSAGKESACNAGDLGSIPGLGRSPGEEKLPTPVCWPGEFHGLQSPWGRKESDTTERLSIIKKKKKIKVLSTLFFIISRGKHLKHKDNDCL